MIWVSKHPNLDYTDFFSLLSNTDMIREVIGTVSIIPIVPATPRIISIAIEYIFII